MISLKGCRKIEVQSKLFYYKCKTHEKTFVWDVEKDRKFYIFASSSGEVNGMSKPSVVAEHIKYYLNNN